MLEGRVLSYLTLLFCCMLAHGLVPELVNRGRTRTVPVQMDMISDNSITICTGAKRSVACREGANIAVTNVFWGRLSDKVCPSDDGDPIVDCDAAPDSLGLVRDQCEGKKECSLTAKHSLLQREHSSHCPGVNKYLIVKFTCMPESKGVLLCDSAETDISCEAGWIMQLADVFWGRRASARTCGLNEGFECDASETASNYLKNKCNGKQKCLVQNEANILDPTKKSSCGDSLEKYLMLNYVCSPATARTTAQQDDDEEKEKEKKVPDAPKVAEKPKPQAAAAIVNPAPKPAVPTATNTASTLLAAANSGKTTTSKTSGGFVPKNEKSEVEEEAEEAEKKSSSTSSSSPAKESSPDASSDTASVRSILSRAKNILKTLDIDGGDVRKKRFRIARPEKSISPLKKKLQKKSDIAERRKNSKNEQKIAPPSVPGPEYPDNFILKSWYGK